MSDTIKLGNLEISSFKVGSTDVDKIYLGSALLYPSTPHDYSQDYLTFENDYSGNVTIYFKASNKNITKPISVSTDGGSTWTSKTSSTGSSGVMLGTIPIGGKMLVKGSNTAYGSSSAFNYFMSNGNIKVSGNIMSLIYWDNFTGQTSINTAYTFKNLFYGLNLTNAENLVLPATTLTDYCYTQMFNQCLSLMKAPQLPATTLADNCYQSMFYGCSRLTTAPELPATTLVGSCYNGMFRNCTSMTTAPELPATTLAVSCYNGMFNGCTSLTTAPSVLPATTLAINCYLNMFNGCTRLTTAPELPATTLAVSCYNGMFNGCTRLTTAPELPATTLVGSCYTGMFRNCTSMTTAPELPATTLATQCYQYMFYNCTSLNSITCLATDISATSCLSNWVNGVSTTGTFTKAASMTDWPSGISGIPANWTVKNYS